MAVMTLGFAGLVVAVNAVPGVATDPSGGFVSVPLGRGTYVGQGTLPISQRMDVVVTQITSPHGGSSGWHSHPGGAIGVVGCAGTDCHSAITIYRSVGGHCVSNTYPNGQTFIERPGEAVVAISTGADTAIVYGIFPGVVPVTGSTKISLPDPGTCGPGLS
jgi:hypothetical protein